MSNVQKIFYDLPTVADVLSLSEPTVKDLIRRDPSRHPGIAAAPARLNSADAERLYYPQILIFSIVRNPANPSIPITNSMRLSESNGGGVNPGM